MISTCKPSNLSIINLKGIIAPTNIDTLGFVFLVMDDDDGPYYDLRQLLTNDDIVITEAQITAILQGILENLCFLEDLNIMHRDIKPANILVSGVNEGAEISVKFCDFGFARTCDTPRVNRFENDRRD